jgi:hypothetical protein
MKKTNLIKKWSFLSLSFGVLSTLMVPSLSEAKEERERSIDYRLLEAIGHIEGNDDILHEALLLEVEAAMRDGKQADAFQEISEVEKILRKRKIDVAFEEILEIVDREEAKKRDPFYILRQEVLSALGKAKDAKNNFEKKRDDARDAAQTSFWDTIRLSKDATDRKVMEKDEALDFAMERILESIDTANDKQRKFLSDDPEEVLLKVQEYYLNHGIILDSVLNHFVSLLNQETRLKGPRARMEYGCGDYRDVTLSQNWGYGWLQETRLSLITTPEGECELRSGGSTEAIRKVSEGDHWGIQALHRVGGTWSLKSNDDEYCLLTTPIEKRKIPTSRGFVFSEKSILILDFPVSQYRDGIEAVNYRTSQFQGREIDFLPAGQDLDLDFEIFEDGIRINWNNGAFLELDAYGRLVDSNFLAPSVYNNTCQTIPSPGLERHRFERGRYMPAVEVLPEARDKVRLSARIVRG